MGKLMTLESETTSLLSKLPSLRKDIRFGLFRLGETRLSREGQLERVSYIGISHRSFCSRSLAFKIDQLIWKLALRLSGRAQVANKTIQYLKKDLATAQTEAGYYQQALATIAKPPRLFDPWQSARAAAADAEDTVFAFRDIVRKALEDKNEPA